MPELNETLQPLTSAEFEAGVKFYYSPKLKPYDNLDVYQKSDTGCILDKKGKRYCDVQYVANDYFSIIYIVFGIVNQGIIHFENCYKSKNK